MMELPILLVLIWGFIFLCWLIDDDYELKQSILNIARLMRDLIRLMPMEVAKALTRLADDWREFGEEPAEKVKRDVEAWYLRDDLSHHAEGAKYLSVRIEPPPPLFNALSHERCIPTPVYVMDDDAKITNYGISESDMNRMAESLSKAVLSSGVALKSTPWEESDMLAQHLNILKDEADEPRA